MPTLARIARHFHDMVLLKIPLLADEWPHSQKRGDFRSILATSNSSMIAARFLAVALMQE